ncbi:hypothetical protein [Flavobacterium sp. LHD-85]|uniref:hypothetical protein n=1 Tax=Flavobacterium sp. LHD-85 TaxID=3071410 RepID=UPI0027E17BEC|nr:hypothetical protein [Flavobacterium sp. LHD-85]MDQ6528061.1 hypothetical protein [Flavobacterium sp. LHD-85]
MSIIIKKIKLLTKTLQILIVFIFLASCNNAENKKDINSSPLIKKKNLPSKAISTNNIAFKKEIINNQFANAPLGEFNFINKDLSLFFKGNYDINKTLITNKFTGKIDTLITFQNKNSLVRFYKSEEKVMLDSLNVSDKNFATFNLGIDIDMSKNKFLSIFKTNKKDTYSDTLSIIDDEENSSVELSFINKKLNKIIIRPW